jgi:hypothetical protein
MFGGRDFGIMSWFANDRWAPPPSMQCMLHIYILDLLRYTYICNVLQIYLDFARVICLEHYCMLVAEEYNPLVGIFIDRGEG